MFCEGHNVVTRETRGVVVSVTHPHDKRVDTPTPFRIPQADDDHIFHKWVLAEGRLHLGRIDIGATRDDQVSLSVRDVEKTILVDPAQVADRAEPVDGPGGAEASPR